jgi:hypothetical protein
MSLLKRSAYALLRRQSRKAVATPLSEGFQSTFLRVNLVGCDQKLVLARLMVHVISSTQTESALQKQCH